MDVVVKRKIVKMGKKLSIQERISVLEMYETKSHSVGLNSISLKNLKGSTIYEP
jgi:hypothetical protein